MSEFQCYSCHGFFQKLNNKEWNDFKAAAEMLKLYPETKNDPTDSICDECNIKFVKLFSALTEEEKKNMRENI